LPFEFSLPLAVSLPIWDQYVQFLKWSLESIGDKVGNGGLAIVVFTIIVRTLILPVTVRSIKSMKAMQDIQPKLKELQKKYKSDRMKMQQETMALYQAYGVNPIAGCLPMLLQIPIFIGVYTAINGLSRSDAGVWAGGFLWLDHLKEPDPLYILPFVAAIFQFIQTFMARPAGQGPVTDPQQRMMNTMMNLMPISVIFFGLTFASGAVLYWAVQSIYGIIQQWFITGWGKLNDWFPNLPELPEHRRLGYHPPRPIEELSNEPPKPKGFLGRWWEKQMQQAQVISEERKRATTGGAAATTATAAKPATAKRGTTAAAAQRPYPRNSPKGRMLAEQARRAEEEEQEADIVEEAVQEADISANGTRRPTPKRTRRAKR
jgi:YidC/Oxa1 family membrane protein insertase